ncbi:hypothetical protein J8I87_11760 [Paraburkholderia sp. LEh10]|uniref:hypothetical protein n=1 Tax=Paraburkholderia sp. LEh10 TaxID=2821353 RepID=UPI001AE399C4|nr:hypothetical protein [Paraburkholderia sp. LEh10]MBP0590376.1 hypothetical protein [Paraburkholderia sp. LEh10]
MAVSLKSVMSFGATALVGVLVGYLGQFEAALDADKAENHTRMLDIQKVPELTWGSHSPVPNVRFTYENTQTNQRIDTIAGTDVYLYNYSDRDAPEVQILITATNADGTLPVYVGARMLDGGVEDFELEQTMKPVAHGQALAFSFKVPSVNRREGGAGRQFELYFAGKAAPQLAVSATAPGFDSRPWDPAHFSESQVAKLPWLQRYSSRVSFMALVIGALAALVFQAVFLRNREKRRMLALTEVVDKSLRQSASTNSLADDERRALASDVALNCWRSLYDSMLRLEQWFSSKPERVS